MTKSKLALAFSVGAVTGLLGEYCIIQNDQRKLFIEFQERKVDEKLLKRADDIFKYGAPTRHAQHSYFRNMVLSYSQELKIPNWVAEHMTKDQLSGPADRKQCRFKPDPDIPAMFSSDNTDYLGSGWTRGHMAAAGNNKFDQDAMQDSFVLSNILPQNFENNAGFWNRTELFTRSLTTNFKDVYILSGPIFIPFVDQKGNKHIKYELIGKNMVAVPTHLFKIIVADNKTLLPPAMAAFIIPNTPIPKEKTLKDYQVSLETVEKRKGVTIHPKLDRETVRDLCDVTGCNLMPLDEFQLYIIRRKMQSATTLSRLDNIWGEMKRKNLKPDGETKNVYSTRKEEIEKIQVFQIKPGQE